MGESRPPAAIEPIVSAIIGHVITRGDRADGWLLLLPAQRSPRAQRRSPKNVISMTGSCRRR